MASDERNVLGGELEITMFRDFPDMVQDPSQADLVMHAQLTTEDGLVGWGESHHARAPGTIGHLVNTTLRGLVLGMDATDTVGIWAKIYKYQLGSHGMGALSNSPCLGRTIASPSIGRSTGLFKRDRR